MTTNLKSIVLFFSSSFFITFSLIGQELPDGFILNEKHLSVVKQKIAAGDKSYVPGYKILIKEAENILKKELYSVINKKNVSPSGDNHDYVSLAPYYWPNPDTPDGLAYIRKDGQRNPEVEEYQDRKYLPDMAADVQFLALAYFYSGDERYSEKAGKLLKTFFLDSATRMNPNLNYAQAIKGSNDGRGAGLIETRRFVGMLETVKLLKGSKGWTNDDDLKLQNWFSDFLNWMQTSKNGMDEFDAPNNHGTWYDLQRLSYATYTGKILATNDIVKNAINRLDKQMDEDGSFPKENERTIALHYNTFNLHAFFMIAQMAESIGVDMWKVVTPSSKSLKKGFDFLYPYLTKKKKWKGKQIKEFDFSEGAPVLLFASVKLGCKDGFTDARNLKLKEESWHLLLMVTEYKE
jgi:hypothetical protein